MPPCLRAKSLAQAYAPPGLSYKRPGIHFEGEFGDEPEAEWVADIGQALFRCSFAMEEVAFFHRASSIAIVGDFIQRFPETSLSGCKATVMRLDGLVGRHGRCWLASA